MTQKIFASINICALIIINIILWSSLYMQFAYHDLPCPLCLYQRMGICAIGLGYLLNLYFGSKAKHYALSIILAILTASISTLQILMHIVPGTGTYGLPIFSIHLYTWCFLICCAVILINSLLIILPKETTSPNKNYIKSANWVAFPLIICIIINIVSAFLLCGFKQCPADPTSYWISQFIRK